MCSSLDSSQFTELPFLVFLQNVICIDFSFDSTDDFKGAKSVPGKKIIAITIAVIVVVTGVLIAAYYFHRKKRRVKGN